MKLIIALSPRERDKPSAIPLVLLAFALLFLIPSVAAQDAEIDKLSDKLAKIILKSPPLPNGNRAVVVIDFCEPGGVVTPFGVRLADQVSAALLRKAGSFQIIDRQKVRKTLEEQKLASPSLQEAKAAASFSKTVQAELFLLGTISGKPNEVQLSVKVFRALDSKRIGSAESRLRNTQEMGNRQESSAAESYPQPGKNGDGYPRCEYCPAPQLSKTAGSKGIKGTVILHLVVTAEGRAEHISVVKKLSPELDNMAIELVQSWRFKPGKGSGGKPVAVMMDIEITFGPL